MITLEDIHDLASFLEAEPEPHSLSDGGDAVFSFRRDGLDYSIQILGTHNAVVIRLGAELNFGPYPQVEIVAPCESLCLADHDSQSGLVSARFCELSLFDPTRVGLTIYKLPDGKFSISASTAP